MVEDRVRQYESLDPKSVHLERVCFDHALTTADKSGSVEVGGSQGGLTYLEVNRMKYELHLALPECGIFVFSEDLNRFRIPRRLHGEISIVLIKRDSVGTWLQFGF